MAAYKNMCLLGKLLSLIYNTFTNHWPLFTTRTQETSSWSVSQKPTSRIIGLCLISSASFPSIHPPSIFLEVQYINPPLINIKFVCRDRDQREWQNQRPMNPMKKWDIQAIMMMMMMILIQSLLITSPVHSAVIPSQGTCICTTATRWM